MHGLAHAQRKFTKVRMNTRAQVNLLDSAVSHVVKFEAQPEAMGLSPFDKASVLKRHQGAMRGALAKLHLLAYLGQAKAAVAFAKKIKNSYDTIETFESIGIAIRDGAFRFRGC
jgi:hypothetical protein